MKGTPFFSPILTPRECSFISVVPKFHPYMSHLHAFTHYKSQMSKQYHTLPHSQRNANVCHNNLLSSNMRQNMVLVVQNIRIKIMWAPTTLSTKETIQYATFHSHE